MHMVYVYDDDEDCQGMETFSALLDFCEDDQLVDSPQNRPVVQDFYIIFVVPSYPSM